jgi:deoxyribodipyrimidine photo-lyase
MAPVLVWLRQDLRLADNAALAGAIASNRPVLCAYVLDDEAPGQWRIGGAARWWLHHSLRALAGALESCGATLVLRRGPAGVEIPRLVAEIGAAAVYWNRCYEPFALARDAALARSLLAGGVEAKSFRGALMFEPDAVRTKSGEAFKVFTPFWRACLALGIDRAPRSAPNSIPSWEGAISSDALEDWRLTPRAPDWASQFGTDWRPGEAGARAALEAFISARLERYAEARDQLGEGGTSRLSAHLHFGEISPLQIWAALPAAGRGRDKFLAEIGWREFSYQLLSQFPALPEKNWRAQFDAFAWRDDKLALQAWQRGQTGYPVVDAAMRELWQTGSMHNRARMIAASFLIKHLLIDWRRGAAWFWNTLLDADLANNSASWQWVAGSGADAAPYFRIFNPVTQGERYDADGVYVRRWLPELALLPDAFIHKPWAAPEGVLRAAGVRLGVNYPPPIIDHAQARARALSAFAAI